ncbi:MAG: hypothetical protein LBU25_06750 [Treponema sp.]|jgi:hypothetical protein|nr:hypothetical protein [Treponema sp.]
MSSFMPRTRSGCRLAFLWSALTLICFHAWCDNKEAAGIPAEKDFAAHNLTLLERSSIDLTGDGIDDTIELYTSAEAYDVAMEFGRIRRMAWDDGHTWTLVVHDGEGFYPLVNERIQQGEVQFWVVGINSKKLEAPDQEDLDMRLYVTVTWGGDFKVLCFTWDKQSASFTKETVVNPSDQWFVRHFNKYSVLDDSYIEPRINK